MYPFGDHLESKYEETLAKYDKMKIYVYREHTISEFTLQAI